MITLGIDFAASPERTACCLIDWNTPTVRLLDRPMSDEELVERIAEASVVAIDVPLGWPTAFVEAVVAHHELNGWPPRTDDRIDLRFRLTDRVIRESGAMPLSVSSERIGVAAMRAARLQRMLAGAGVEVDRSGTAGRLIEVYPAAALRAWGLTSTGYKGSKKRETLAMLVRDLLGQCGPLGGIAAASLEGCDDDDFDAFICAVLARAAHLGLTIPPSAEQLPTARREGWIHLPAGSVDQGAQLLGR